MQFYKCFFGITFVCVLFLKNLGMGYLLNDLVSLCFIYRGSSRKNGKDASLGNGRRVSLQNKDKGKASSCFPWELQRKVEETYSFDPGGLWRKKGGGQWR